MKAREEIRTGCRFQKGATLIELLVALMITGFLASSVALVVANILNNNSRNTAHMLAVKEVENAVHWISRDARMAQSIVLDDESDNHFPVELTWMEWDGTSYKVIYALVSTDLERQYWVGPEGALELVSTNIVARHISNDIEKTICEFDNGVFGLTLTAQINNIQGGIETRIIEIRPRTM